jgi:hypothetical protein
MSIKAIWKRVITLSFKIMSEVVQGLVIHWHGCSVAGEHEERKPERETKRDMVPLSTATDWRASALQHSPLERRDPGGAPLELRRAADLIPPWLCSFRVWRSREVRASRAPSPTEKEPAGDGDDQINHEELSHLDTYIKYARRSSQQDEKNEALVAVADFTPPYVGHTRTPRLGIWIADYNVVRVFCATARFVADLSQKIYHGKRHCAEV